MNITQQMYAKGIEATRQDRFLSALRDETEAIKELMRCSDAEAASVVMSMVSLWLSGYLSPAFECASQAATAVSCVLDCAEEFDS